MPSLAVAWTQEVCLRDEAEEALRDIDRLSSLLSQAEKLACRRLATEKRRVDWLSGRLAAKRALAARINAAPRDIEILNEPSGRPYCPLPAAPSFSITHTAAGGLCAVGAGSAPIGADWETIAARGPDVLAFYTHHCERTPQVLASAEAQTRLWAVKEAVLKFLGIGLGCDPRDVRVLPSLRLEGSALLRWKELGRPPLSLWEKTLPDSVIAVAYSEPGDLHGKSQE
jgi:4'-phosphopantetheinyl transferase